MVLINVMLLDMLLMLTKSKVRRTVGIHTRIDPLSVTYFRAVKMTGIRTQIQRAWSIYASRIPLSTLTLGAGNALWGRRWGDWKCRKLRCVMFLFIRGWHYSLSTLYDRFLHSDRPMHTMKLMVQP